MVALTAFGSPIRVAEQVFLIEWILNNAQPLEDAVDVAQLAV
jgi:hypothetical protein